ncbi:MAG TPA: O-antigen ligase family protein, partial [Burkholderiaceae bacterium]
MAFIVLGALVPLPLILRDYRTGVAMLAAMLPIASMLPSVKGLNPLNFVTAATLVSLFLRDAFSSRRAVRLPGVLWAGLVLPATWAIVVAWPHIPEGVHNYPLLDNAREIYDPWSYVAARYAKPLFYYLSFAMLVANAARDSRRPERFALLLAAAMVLPSLAVFVTVHQYPGTLADVSRDREFMAPRGMHANEFGMLLAAGSGPLLFGAAGAGGRTARWTLRAAFALVTLALVLTFSRGGLTAWLVVVGGYLVQHRRLKTFLVAATVGALALAAAPQSVTERFGAGMHEGAISDVSDVGKDELTAGRVHGWQLLAPEVLDSPWFGRGLGSTQWSQAVEAGRYKANHPHNIYLELLMDVGLVGFAAMAFLHWTLLRRLRALAADASLGPALRGFFAGARWSLLGVLVMAATTAYYMPNSAQFPLWFCFGMAFSVAPSIPRAASALRALNDARGPAATMVAAARDSGRQPQRGGPHEQAPGLAHDVDGAGRGRRLASPPGVRRSADRPAGGRARPCTGQG